MTWASPQMISLGLLLLLLNGQISTTTAASCRKSIRIKQFNETVGELWKWHLSRPKDHVKLNGMECNQWAKDITKRGQSNKYLNNRSLAPWKYRIDRNDSRLPHEIAFAECLCQGCIINQTQTHDYNSVPVYAPLIVLMKTPCPNNPNGYVFKMELIQIPVACTCVMPIT